MQPIYSLCYTKYKLITCITNVKDITQYISTIFITIILPTNFKAYINNFIELQPEASKTQLSSLINNYPPKNTQPGHYHPIDNDNQTVYDKIILRRNETNEFFPTNNFPIFNGCRIGKYQNEKNVYIKIFHTNKDEKNFNNRINTIDTTDMSTILKEKYFDYAYPLLDKEIYFYY
jgi:hypothetical protein